MKKLLIFSMLLVSVSLFAQQGVNVRIQQGGVDIADLSGFHFSVELVPGSGDFQYETDFANGFQYIDIGMGSPNSFLQFDLGNFVAAWEGAMDFELIVWESTGNPVSTILNCGFIAAGFSYYGWGFYGGDVPLEVPYCGCGNPWPFVSVDVGTPSNPGDGYGNGLPNEDLLDNPENIGFFFTLTIDDSAPVDVTICLDHMFLGFIPYNLAYWDNGVWTYVTCSWTNPGTANACVTFTIDPTSRADIDIPIVFSNGPNPDDGLPVELTNFTAINQQGEFVNVSWTTQSESNMSYYKVYREGQEIFLTEALNQVSEQVYSFVDIPEFYETYYYTLEAVALDGTSAFWGPTEIIFGADVNEITEITQLGNNYPNPFNPVTTINFSVKENETGILTIYNAKGQVVTNETFTSGVHIYNWNANKYSSGIYFYKLQTGSFSEVKKMLLIK